MFFSSIRTEPIPERVISICRIVAEKSSIPKKELESILVPKTMHVAATSYFSPVFETAKELNLIDIDNDNNVIFVGEKENIKSYENFRRYCNNLVFNDESTDFYKIIECFLDANDSWFRYKSVTSDDIVRIISEKVDIESQKLKKDVILGVRFWINFLGFGCFQEGANVFLPNMYTALKDFIYLGNIEKDKEYSIREFLNCLHKGSSVSLHNSSKNLTLNLAFSNALRFMYDNNEIILKNIPDSEERWTLFENESHVFSSSVTHIILKKAVK